MYITNNRLLARKSFAGTGQEGGVLINTHFSVPTVIEGVYSWRTGRHAISDPPVSPHLTVKRQDSYGIRTPSETGSLVSRLADRKRYIDELQRTLIPAETATGSTSVDRVSKTDTGHLFASHKTFRVPYAGTLDYYRSSSARYVGDLWAAVGYGCVNPSPYTFGFTTRSGSLSVSNTDRQGMANRYFAATAPDRNVGTLGVTLIELLRGDIPSLLKNYRTLAQGFMNRKNYFGSEFLNIQFGWTPLIQEYFNLIKVGLNLERVIYYESFRRKRQWEGPSVSSSGSSVISLNALGSPYPSAYRFSETGDVMGPNAGAGVLYEQQTSMVESEDYHWSSRYTGLAKASRRAESFSDQAMDVFKRLGAIDDPTLLWDLTPYSWLVDWFTTMGDSLSNANVYSPLSGKYNVDFAYLTTQRVHSEQGHLLRRSGVLSPYYLSHAVTQPTSVGLSTTRWRDRATPFGFGTQMASLNAGQFAILVALGLAQRR